LEKTINKIAVLGSGVMGSRIACHFAGIGVEVLLLDIVPRELTEKETKAGATLEMPKVRNRIVDDALKFALKSNPSPIYKKAFASRIETGNFDDDLHKIADVDWIIEVVVERLDIKQQVFEKVEKYRKPGTHITTNTSGIPINMLIDGRSDDFRKHFCGTHFFNPPRYLKLLEIIPSTETNQEVIDFMMDYGSRFLGKKTVLCKDTPAFIANRVGVYSIQALFHLVEDMDLTVDEIDKLTGPAMGRPKSATFRTSDVVGLDTLVHVANGVRENCPKDECNPTFEITGFVKDMLEKNRLGSKTGEGFYKKTKGEDGKRKILSLDLKTGEYTPTEKVKFATLDAAKAVDDLAARTKLLYKGKDKAGDFYRAISNKVFAYVSNRIPEISDETYRIDDAMMAGFGWEIGPFASWDAVGVKAALESMEKTGDKPAAWVQEMLDSGAETFFKIEDGVRKFYDVGSKSYKVIPGQEELVILSNISEDKVIWKNSGTTIKDIGDGILNIEFHTKMNTIGGDVLAGLNKAMDLAEEGYRGLTIYNDGANFSAGANVGMIFMMAVEQEFDELDFAIQAFQKTTTRLRHCNVPVVAAPHNLTLGGGCEICLHVDKVVAHAEAYIGLVEFGVGLIPGGGGTKEFAVRLSDELHDGDMRINQFRNRFLTVGQAKVSTSAHEAFELGYLREGIDEVVVSREHQLSQAKAAAMALADAGYVSPKPRTDIRVLGDEALGVVYVGADSMEAGNYISEHDQLISEKLGFAMAGGDLSNLPKVSEKYLLDLERRQFLELCAERKTLERLQSIITTGKVLRN